MERNEAKEFIKEHLLTMDDITDNILKDMYADEGIIITTEDGKIIDIDAVWSEDNKHKDCWNVRVYKTYEQYVRYGYVDLWDSVTMEDFATDHIRNYMCY